MTLSPPDNPSPEKQNNTSPGEQLISTPERPYATVSDVQLRSDIAHFWKEIGHAALKLKKMMDELDLRMERLIEPEKVDEFKDWRGPNNG